MKIKGALSGLLFAGMMVSGTAQATLIDRGGGLIYDADLNITWTANANLHGVMEWDTALSWVQTLVVGGYSGWRLPKVSQPDATCSSSANVLPLGMLWYGYNCTGSELGHLFYSELGGVAGSSILSSSSSALALFFNIHGDESFWTYAPVRGANAWYFSVSDGGQNTVAGPGALSVWAVRDGDVASVPEPGSLALLGLALGGLAVSRRKYSKVA